MTQSHKVNHISGLLDEIFRRRGWDRRLGMHEVFHFWNEVVGDDVAKQAQPYVIRGNVLWVHVSDSVWMQQLHLQKAFVLESINQRLKDEKLNDIRFQLDSRLDSSYSVAGQNRPRQSVNKSKMKKFEKIASSLRDDEVKDAMKKLWVKSHK